MFLIYVLKRILYGVLMYVVLIFSFSILFNSVTETTLRGQIMEQINQEMARQKGLTQEQLDRFHERRVTEEFSRYHLDRPVLERIFFSAIRSITFDFGKATSPNLRSSTGEKTVITIVAEQLPRTVLLFTTQVVLVVLIGVPLGLRLARKPNAFSDRSNTMLAMVTTGMPAWWLGMIAIMIFAYAIPIFPSGAMHRVPAPDGFDGFLDLMYHLALPLIVLVVLGIPGTAYVVRNVVLGTLQEDYVMAARARGISENLVLYGHTLRSSMPAIITIAVLSLFGSIAGNILFEAIFSWPGIGNLYFVAVQQNDVPVLMGNLAIQTLFNMVGFILLDIIYGYLDPRIKVGGKA